jgi:hypothetical protein
MEALTELLSDRDFFDTLCTATMAPLVLPFVNRKNEVISLASTLILNSINAATGVTDNQVYLLPFLPQMFGAGKTTMGKELLDQAKRYKAEILAKLNKVTPTKSEHISAQMDKFLSSTYVKVSLDELPAPQR